MVEHNIPPGGRKDAKEPARRNQLPLHAYLYVPRVPANSDEVSDNIDLGAILRLGSYSDLESQAHRLQEDQKHYYPLQHIQDEGGLGNEAIYKNAAGSDSGKHHGILLACDGRVLLKSGEKMYVESGDQNVKVHGNYKLDATGSVTVTAGEAVSVKSGGEQKITLNASDQTGDIELKANNLDEDLIGHVQTNIAGDRTTHVKGHINSYTEGYLKSITIAGSLDVFVGGLLQVSGSLTGQIYTVRVLGSILTASFDFFRANLSVNNVNKSVRRTQLDTIRNAITGVNLQLDQVKVWRGGARAERAGVDVNETQVRLVGNQLLVEDGGEAVSLRTRITML
ncbi:hypothetical protein JM93_01412 [Roseibium hamelinense]|uniref:Uncharacterized protein n=1 Tax=Roseibium hamelinense TaxID=150831 RepID=A0A562T9T0_9HYPH|nr:hypothetical protein [Roseibium hamelinense]MTI45206.1 hypothetical protein [Roseibium hamelinense]TWI90431.1 hypothetical protein JM93_01412 [Roseibium hamelinense]